MVGSRIFCLWYNRGNGSHFSKDILISNYHLVSNSRVRKDYLRPLHMFARKAGDKHLCMCMWCAADRPQCLCPVSRASAIKEEVAKGLMMSSKAKSTLSRHCVHRDSGQQGLKSKLPWTNYGSEVNVSQLNCGCDRTTGFPGGPKST